MNALSQTTDTLASPCSRFAWCDAQFHARGGLSDVDVHTSSRYFLQQTCELALEIDDHEGRPHVWLTFDNRPTADPYETVLPDTFYDSDDLRERAVELRRVADAADAAADELDALKATMEAPC